MRITANMISAQLIHDMNANMERLDKLRTQAATAKKFQSASDDPFAARSALILRSSLESAQAYLNTAQTTDDWMTATETAMAQMETLAAKAKDLALKGISDGNDGNRPLLGAEINELLQQALETINTQHQGEYLFAGYKTKTQPFTLQAGTPDAITYNGDAGLIQRALGTGNTVTVNIDGDAAFTPLLTAFITTRDALNADDPIAVQAAVTDLQTALEGEIQARSLNGLRQRQVRTAQTRLEDTQTFLSKQLSQAENADMVETVTLLNQQETTYQTVLEVGRRALQMVSLFDVL
ncbi:MAG: flagellar hook-associated protein FlgL [Anaerolineales bacterium]|nr:flagellar hook-associated protein FlgL [Anaerolineales bacterium]